MVNWRSGPRPHWPLTFLPRPSCFVIVFRAGLKSVCLSLLQLILFYGLPHLSLSLSQLLALPRASSFRGTDPGRGERKRRTGTRRKRKSCSSLNLLLTGEWRSCLANTHQNTVQRPEMVAWTSESRKLRHFHSRYLSAFTDTGAVVPVTSRYLHVR